MNDRLNLPTNADIKKIIKFDKGKLPSFPQAAIKLIEVSKDETASISDFVKIVETDPGISVRVLEIVNSAMYGLGRKITALSEALAYLGLDEIKKIAIGMTIFEKMFKSGESELFNRLLFWRHSLATAVLSMELARETGYSNPEEAYMAGLLHDVGKIFLDMQSKKKYSDFIKELTTSTDFIIEKERNWIGLGHDDIGAFFCSGWKLPEKLVIAVKYHHQPFEHMDLSKEEMQLVAIVSMANFLCWTQGVGSLDIVHPPILSPEVGKIIDFDKVDLIKCISNMNQEIESISKFYNFVFPSATQLKENLLWANLKLSKANTRYYYQEAPQLSDQDETHTHKGSRSFDMELDFAKPLAKATSVKEVLDIVMFQVGQIFQPLHWSILLKDPKTSNMIFSVVVGANKEKLQGVKLNKGEGIAGYIMETGESVIVENVEKDSRFSARVDKYSGFKTQSIIGTPLKTENKTFGVIELINRISNDPFTQRDLKILSSIAEYAGIAIERSYYNQALTNLATKDPLTGFKNRWSFERAVVNKDTVLRRYGVIFSMLIIGINQFSHANESGDLTAGEKILKRLAQTLIDAKRRDDDIFRYGEETFILLLPNTYSDSAEKVQLRVSKAFAQTASEKEKNPATINISTYTISADDASQLKKLVGKFLSKSRTSVTEDLIEDMEQSLQPFLEDDIKQESEKNKKAKTVGKNVSLGGKFIRLKTGETGRIRVEKLSLVSTGFRISKLHRIKVNDFLDIHFLLDSIKKSRVERRIIVRSIKGNYIHADFYNPPPFAKKLGFYLMN